MYLETTCDAIFGEDPISAAARLGLIRPDILAKKRLGVKFMGEETQARPMKEPTSDVESEAGDGAEPGDMGAIGGAATADLPDSFFEAGVAMSERHGWNFVDLLAVMSNESGISSHQVNHANPTSGAVGLIQFMPDTAAKLLGGSPLQARARMVAMGPTEQLEYVEKFFAPHAGLDSAARFYQATFLPATLDRVTNRDAPLTGRNGPLAFAYGPNIGFDTARKGYITINDLQAAMDRSTRSARFQEAVERTRAAGGSGTSSLISGRSGAPGKLGNVVVWALLLTAAGGLLSYADPATFRQVKSVALHPMRSAHSVLGV